MASFFPLADRAGATGIAGVLFIVTPVLAQDYAENNAAQWGTFASDGAPRSVSNDTTRVRAGNASIRFDTASGFDTGVTYPGAGNLNFNAASSTHLIFWSYGDNNTPIGFQGNQPIIVLRSGASSFRYEPQTMQTANHAWRLIKVPLAGGDGWVRSTTGNPTLTDIDMIEIHQDTWDAGFRMYYDGVRFANLPPGYVPPPGPPPPPGVDPVAIESRVLLYIFDPIMENFGSQRLHQVYGWESPVTLAESVRQDLLASSHGRARYTIVETVIADEHPRFQDGFQHTDESFHAAWIAHVFHNSTFDYVGFCNGHGSGDRVDAGDFDELWLYAPPIAGMWESCMAGQGAYWINGPAYPAAGRTKAFPIMGWNYERGVGEAIHSYGHRAENVMVHSYGPWEPNQSTTWNRFALYDQQAPGLGGVGNVHFPVNATSDYDYFNQRFVLSEANNWLNYPNLGGAPVLLNARAWSPNGADPQREYLNWWYSRMPHIPGRAPDGFLGNWWRYHLDLEQFKGWNGRVEGTFGIPAVTLIAPDQGAVVSGIVRVHADAWVDGALGRVDFYIDGDYRASDFIAPFTFDWNTATAGPGPHTIFAKAYELQNGTEAVSPPVTVWVAPTCYANCDSSTTAPILNVSDFICFLNRYAAADPYANCDNSTLPPVLNINDFICFSNTFAAGCL